MGERSSHSSLILIAAVVALTSKYQQNMIQDFRKFATSKMGINSLVLDDVVAAQNQYLNPYILEERQLNVTQMDVFSRLMMDRIIFLGTQIDDYTANTLQAQLLYLDSTDPGKDISIYINSPGEVFMPVLAFMIRCSLSKVTLPPSAPVWLLQWLPCFSWQVRRVSVQRCLTAV